MTQEALKHLKAITEAFGSDAGIELDQKAWAKLHAAIKQALAQTQEPVAWWNDTGTHIDLNVSGRGTPLYTTPPQRTWVGLTDKELMDMYNEPRSDAEMIAFGREVEAKLKELNT